MKLHVRFLQRLGRTALVLAGTYATLATAAATADVEQIQRGQYLATAGDCVACHTAPGREPFAGGLSLPTPIGSITSTNITPSKTHGIGNYTLQQFTDALRRGRRADGQNLYPAMPYTSYALLTDDDAAALYAYFMKGVKPVDSKPPETSLPFPFNIRMSMAVWNLMFLDTKTFNPDPTKSLEWNRGAYLARGLAHCSTCHSPRNVMMAEDVKRDLAGGAVGTWYAPNITSDENSGIGSWSAQEIATYLRTGRVEGKAQAAGPMAEAIDHSLRHMSDADLQAMAVYLKDTPAIHNQADSRPAHAYGSPADDLNSIRGVPLPSDLSLMTGPQLFDAHCATCHQAHGQGSPDGGLPSLYHNTALGRDNANNVVMVILEGIQRQQESADIRMPGFAKTLSDKQIATLATYLTQRYGNPKAAVTAEQVSSMRTGGQSSTMIGLARLGMAIGILVAVFLIFAAVRRGRRKAA